MLISFVYSQARFLRGAVYGYKEKAIDVSQQFDYGLFIDSVSGYVKFILENLNFLTFEEDRSKILKVLFLPPCLTV